MKEWTKALSLARQHRPAVLDPLLYRDLAKAEHGTWRAGLREALFYRRKGKSDPTGKTLGQGFDMHEALFSRRWLPKDQQIVLMCEYNVLLLRREEHIPHPPSRTEAYEILCKLYGRDIIDAWVESIPFKSIPDLPWKTLDK